MFMHTHKHIQKQRMSNVHFFFLFLFFTIFASSASLNNSHKCSLKQSRALLHFKQNIFHSNLPIDDQVYYIPCQDWLGSGYYPIINNWNPNLDCCNWNGVTCNHSTGDVIGLDLSCGLLQGTIYSNSSLFQLPQLRTLNLAFNNFFGSQIPREIGILYDTLTHLNISQCGFVGKVPSEISLLRKLISLDLSGNSEVNIESHVLSNFLRNSTLLEELSLSGVNISSVLPAYLNISSYLRLLNLGYTGLQGNLPLYIFKTQSLEYVDLSGNMLIGHIPSQISLLRKLVSLDLSSSGLEIQPHVFLSLLQNMTLLKLDLSYCDLVGSLPKSLAKLRYLIELNLSYNKLNGSLPSWLFSLPSLERMYLTSNLFSGNVPFTLFSLQSLTVLSLGQNNLSGQIDVLDQGPVQQTFQQLTNLISLDLSYNNLIGEWELDTLLSSLRNLVDLDLSHSGLSVMTSDATQYVNPEFQFLKLSFCNIKVFPASIRPMKNLKYLDLSHNEIHGSIPDWVGELRGPMFYHLDLSFNFISHLPPFQWDGLQCMYLQSNKIQGPFPLSICNMNYLFALDMSNNSFGGLIPKCFGNFPSSLRIINLRNNYLQGTIPDANNECGSLEGFILNGNQLEGEVPRFLSKCRNLKVVDLGDNYLNGTFPYWLGDLPNLQVLVLKTNNFHGPIVSTSMNELLFQHIQVLDISHNRFIGQLPEKYFKNFKFMKDVVKQSTQIQYLFVDGKYYSITITIKGLVQQFPQIFVHYTIIDVSQNEFQGAIPNIVGNLNSLKGLNLSHNHLNGRIPHSLGSLSEIESLDLSWNQLTGEIPKDLANLKRLSALNLSNNHLVGHIPQGTQFNTFDGSSFGENFGLCGFPLRDCEHSGSQQPIGDEYVYNEDGLTWKVVLLGYGCGTIIGLVLGYFMLSTGKPKWFKDISNSVEHMTLKRRNKRRRVSIRK